MTLAGRVTPHHAGASISAVRRRNFRMGDCLRAVPTLNTGWARAYRALPASCSSSKRNDVESAGIQS